MRPGRCRGGPALRRWRRPGEGRWQKLAITRLHARVRDAGLGRADRCAGARAPHQASLPERALADRIAVLRQRVYGRPARTRNWAALAGATPNCSSRGRRLSGRQRSPQSVRSVPCRPTRDAATDRRFENGHASVRPSGQSCNVPAIFEASGRAAGSQGPISHQLRAADPVDPIDRTVRICTVQNAGAKAASSPQPVLLMIIDQPLSTLL